MLFCEKASKLREAVTIHKRIELFALLTERTLVRWAGEIAVKVVGVKYGVDLVAYAHICTREDGSHTYDLTAVVANSLGSCLCGITRSNGNCKDKHVLACDHRRDIISEQKLR